MSSSDVAGLVINNDEDEVRENGEKEGSFVLVEEGEIKLKEDAANTLQRLLFKIISSGMLLKYVACISGLWVGSHLWSFLSVLFTSPIMMMSLIGEAVIVFYCDKKSALKSNSTVTFCRIKPGATCATFRLTSTRFISSYDLSLSLLKWFALSRCVFLCVEAATSRKCCRWTRRIVL